MYRSLGLVEQTESFFVAVSREQSRFDRGEESAQRAEGGIHRGGFVAAVDHAIGAGGIAGLGAVVAPVGSRDKLGECFRITILQQVAGLLPSENVVSGHAPWSAGISAFAHQEF